MTSRKKKRIALLTSGGDCAGLNAAIRAVVLKAASYGWEVIGINSGVRGLMARPLDVKKLTVEDVDAFVLRQGGTILGTTNKGKISPDIFVKGFKKTGSDALIGIGGDGSLAILRRLTKHGKIPFVAIPKTIDNDLGITENSIGFDTAVSVATEALDRLQPTAVSHDRIMVLEVMGRDAGHIGLASGIAGGADVILIPEIPYDIKKVAKHINEIRKTGRESALVVVSEAVRTQGGGNVKQSYFDGQERLGGIGHYIAKQIAEACHAETRVTVLGHVQRGAAPSAQDRLLASAFGVRAVELVYEKKFDRMVAWSNRQVIDVPVDKAIKKYQTVELDGSLVMTARGMGICLGD